jgi:hypothetical protein
MEDQPLPPAPTPEWRPEQPGRPAPAGIIHGDHPTPAAYIQITPTTVVPASQTHMLLMSVTGIAGIMGAVLTAYIAAHAPAREFGWFLGFAVAELALAAVAELALALTVVFRLRIARGGHVVRCRKARLLPRAQPLPRGQDSLRSGVPGEQQQEGSPGDGAGAEAGLAGS